MYATFGCTINCQFLLPLSCFKVHNCFLSSFTLFPVSAIKITERRSISPCLGSSGFSRRPLTTRTRLRSQGSQYGIGIACGYDRTVTGFPPNSSVFPWQYYFISTLFSFIYRSSTSRTISSWERCKKTHIKNSNKCKLQICSYLVFCVRVLWSEDIFRDLWSKTTLFYCFFVLLETLYLLI
jgi:hypothetical protein